MEEIVRQVGYLPELYEDAWSEKYKKESFLIRVQLHTVSNHNQIWFSSNIIYKDECLFVCIELIQIHISEPNFAHVSPLAWKRP
jgi:hypothetical protein